MSNKNVNLLSNVQYFLSSILAICFAIGIFPFLYKKVVSIVAVCLAIQVIVSVIRGRLLNVFLEIFLVGLAALSLIPILGLVASFFAMVVCILEMAAFKNGVLYQQMDMRAFNSKNKTKTSKKKSSGIKKPEPKFEDASFSEK